MSSEAAPVFHKSKKQRSKPILASKLHDLPVSKPTGVGAAVAALPNRVLGQGKRKVWVGIERCRVIRQGQQGGATHVKTQNPLQPTLEALRAAWIFKLRKLFKDDCSGSTKLSPPALAFERWFQTNEMLYQESFRSKKKITWSSIQKGASAPAAEILKQDLVRASFPVGEAERIVCSMYQQTATAVLDLAAKRKEMEGSKKPPNAVQVIRHAHTLDLFLSKKHILKLNHEHYDKLAALWKVSHQEKDDTTAAFHDDLYSLLARYYSIQGPGFQAACPEQVFDMLAHGLAVTHECFASPLNCYYGSYCSAFEDVDGPFGTSGSFWDFSPTQGSFQANPPFVHHVMNKMVEKIESLLQNEQSHPFSFVVIVPVWLEESSYQQMVNSRFMVEHWIIAKADHGFCDGAQHQRRDRYRVSPYDTAIFILQNKAGRIKYPPLPSLQNDLRAAFATGVPTEAAMKRRKRDGRGETDEDGGGGVYKGKKRNRTGAGVEQRKSKERMNNKPKKNKKNKK